MWLQTHVGMRAAARRRTDVLAELGHEGLAEAHDLVVRLALGVEVAAALAAAHRQRGQAVLENLRARQTLISAGSLSRAEDPYTAVLSPVP